MTVRELITRLENLPEEKLDMEVCYYDEWQWVSINHIREVETDYFNGKPVELTKVIGLSNEVRD